VNLSVEAIGQRLPDVDLFAGFVPIQTFDIAFVVLVSCDLEARA
jgi:hypothetical protein